MRHLRTSFSAFVGFGLLGCSDPPLPDPLPPRADIPRWSTAPYVSWQGPTAPGPPPWALVLDTAGGPIDTLLHDFDVATVLNDRFSAWFLTPEAVPAITARWGTHSITFLDARGCPLAGPDSPQNPEALIALANAALRAAAKNSEKGASAKTEPGDSLAVLEVHPGISESSSPLQIPAVFQGKPEAACKSPGSQAR